MATTANEYPSFKRLSAHLGSGSSSSSSNKSTSVSLQGHKQSVYSLAWSCDGKKLGSASADLSIRIWNMGKSSIDCSAELKGAHKDPINSLLWDPDHPEKMATCSTDKYVALWDIRTPKSAAAKIATEGENINMSWSPDGKTLAVGNKDDSITFIDPRGGGDAKSEKTYISKIFRNDTIIHSTSWNYNGDFFFQTTGDGVVEILSFPSLEHIYSLQAHTSLCSSICFDPRGKYFATGGGDAIVCIWDIDTMLCKGTISRLDSSIRSICFSHDGELIASGSAEDRSIDISHVESGELVHSIKLSSSSNGIQSIAFHPSRHILAYCCDETSRTSSYGSVHVFNAF